MTAQSFRISAKSSYSVLLVFKKSGLTIRNNMSAQHTLTAQLLNHFILST